MNDRGHYRDEGIKGTEGAAGTVSGDQSELPKHVIHTRELAVDDRIEKSGGDYRFVGEVRAVFTKRNGVVRYVVENDDGILHIFSAGNLKATTIEYVQWADGIEVTKQDAVLLELDAKVSGAAYVEAIGNGRARRIAPTNLTARVYEITNSDDATERGKPYIKIRNGHVIQPGEDNY